jgi:hypothetical protein
MKIGFDIGGVLSKYPERFKELISNFEFVTDIYIITDQHPKDKVLQVLIDNGWYSTYRSQGLIAQTKNEFWDTYLDGIIHPDNVYCADYEKYGNMAKAILIKELKLDIFIDDFEPYLAWDSTLGPQPILLKLMPDVFKPYWSPKWKQDGGDFGRRVYTHDHDSRTKKD